jgi:hypothetical protein
MIPFGLASLMTVSLPIARRAMKCLMTSATAFYLFDEGSGQVLYDHSGNGNHGTLGAGAAAPTWGPTGAVFAGDDKVDCGTAAALNLANQDSTIVVICTPTTANIEGIFGKCKIDKNSWGIGQATGKFRFDFWPASGNFIVTADAAYVTGQPYMVAGVRSGTTLSLYVNGVKQTGTQTVTSEPSTAASPFVIGGRSGSATFGFNGTIHAGVAVPFALTQGQIDQTCTYFKALLTRRGLTPLW